MIIHDIADYLVNLTCKDIKPDIYSVFDSPYDNNCPNNVNSEKLTILEILNAIGCRLKNLFGFVKINTTTETIDEGEAVVNVSGDVDNLNFDFKIPHGKTGPQGPAGERGPKGDPGPENLVIITATASTTVQGEYIPDTTYTKALADIQANKAVMIKLENVPGRYYIPYSSSNAEILASAGTVSDSNQSIELYLLKWAAQGNIITLAGTKEGCIADGGTAGQVLTKKSDDSFDTEWKLQYKIITDESPFNTAELTALYNNGTLIYINIKKTNRFFNVYYNTGNGLLAIGGMSYNTERKALLVSKCLITKNNNLNIYTETCYCLPYGGSTNQILAKKSNTDGDTKWIDPPSGSGLTKTVLWTNSNPNSAFVDQTITTPEDGFNYPLLIIDFAETATSAIKLSTVVTNTARFGTNAIMLNDYKGYRTIRTVNGISWTVSAGFNLSTNANDNAICIPLNIIGYK